MTQLLRSPNHQSTSKLLKRAQNCLTLAINTVFEFCHGVEEGDQQKGLHMRRCSRLQLATSRAKQKHQSFHLNAAARSHNKYNLLVAKIFITNLKGLPMQYVDSSSSPRRTAIACDSMQVAQFRMSL
jgi:hypothetical protein